MSVFLSSSDSLSCSNSLGIKKIFETVGTEFFIYTVCMDCLFQIICKSVKENCVADSLKCGIKVWECAVLVCVNVSEQVCGLPEVSVLAFCNHTGTI